MENLHNYLLTYLSEKGSGEWDEYLRAYKSIGLEFSPFGSALRLFQLAHFEFDYISIDSNKRWNVSTPCLVLTLDGRDQTRSVLCGKRNPAFLDTLQASAHKNRVHMKTTSQLNAPDIIEFEAASMDDFNRTATQVGIKLVQYAAWNTALILPKLESLTFREKRLKSDISGQVKQFDFQSFGWKTIPRENLANENNGVFRYGQNFDKKHALLVEDQAWHVEAGCAIWWSMARNNIQCLQWSPSRQTLSIPYFATPPLLISRAMVLCSGYLPTSGNGQSIYRNISQPFAELIADWLGQKLEITDYA